MSNDEYINIARYCAIEGQYCQRSIPLHPYPSCFLAYPSGHHWSDFATELKAELDVRGIRASSWEHQVTGSVIFKKICDSIYSHSFVLCELTDLNPNVLFEAGYALGAGRDAVFLIDRTRTEIKLPILKTKEHCFYATRDDIHAWVNEYLEHHQLQSETTIPPNVLQMNGILDAVEKRGTLYYLRPRLTTQIVKSIGIELNKSLFKVTTSDPLDPTFDDFYNQARQIKESQLVVGVLVTNKTRDAYLHNAPVILLLGFAAALGKQIFVLQEQPNESLLDLGTVIRPFTGEKSAKRILEQWIKTQSAELVQYEQQAGRVRRRREESSRIRDLFLGSPDALQDYDLMDYFVKTAYYQQALTGVKQLFIGRKGAGKSATFRALQDVLGRKQKNILVSIAPSDFQFERLTGLLADQYEALHPDFVYQSFWRYIILTEVIRTVYERYQHFFQSPVPAYINQILSYVREHHTILEADFATRAIQTLDSIQLIPHGQSKRVSDTEIEKLLQRARMHDMEQHLQSLAKEYPIFVLVDDIDKQWNPNYPPSVRLLLGLINQVSQLNSGFKGSLTAAIFLRQDIFEVLRKEDEDLVKRNIANLRWDEQALLNVLAERISYRLNEDVEDVEVESDEEIWETVLPRTIENEQAWSYIVKRSLMRPRDVLQFCQYAIDKAQLRRHSEVSESDVLEAERDYSDYMFQALRLEYLHVYPDLDQVIFEFVAWRIRGTVPDVLNFIQEKILQGALSSLSWVSSCAEDPERLLKILYEVGFCGLGDAKRNLQYYSFDRTYEEARAICYVDPFVIIHPAFHRSLELQDTV